MTEVDDKKPYKNHKMNPGYIITRVTRRQSKDECCVGEKQLVKVWKSSVRYMEGNPLKGHGFTLHRG